MIQDVKTVVIETLSNITGLCKEDVEKIEALNLFENGILDSLSFVTLINEVEEKLEKNIDIRKGSIENFFTINSIVDFINK